MLKQVFLAHWELVVTRFGPRKNPKCLEKGPLWDQKWVKKGSKTHFSKSDLGPFGMQQVFLAHVEPLVTRFGPSKIPNCFANRRLWDQKWVKNAFFQKGILDQSECSNKCLWPIGGLW